MTVNTRRCKVHIGTLRRCGNAAINGLEICEPCLDTLLAEDDPRRRRNLAVLEDLPTLVVERLAKDPDQHVRARIATRPDLSPTLALQFASDAESSPIVWRALAVSSHGVQNAEALVATGDPLTLATLVTHPGLDGELLDQLADHSDPDVSTSAIATRAGLRPNPTIRHRIDQAARADTRPITSPPKGTPAPVPLPSPPATPVQSVQQRPSVRSSRVVPSSVPAENPVDLHASTSHSEEVPGPLRPPPSLALTPPGPLPTAAVSVPETLLIPVVVPGPLGEVKPVEVDTAIGPWQGPPSEAATLRCPPCATVRAARVPLLPIRRGRASPLWQ